MFIKIFRMRALVLALIGIACLPMTADACESYWTAAYKCAQGCDCGGSPVNPDGGSRRDSSEDAERAKRNAVVDIYNAKIKESDDALRAGRYREAARLRREAVRLHGPLGENEASRQALINAERFERYADANDAATAGNAARDAGNLAQAIAYYQQMIRDPGFDSDANRKIIADLQARLTTENEQKAAAEKYQVEREAQDIKTAGIMHKKIEDFAATLDTAAPATGKLVTQGETVGDALNTHKVNAPVLEFGDPNSPEAQSEQARQGLDMWGRLKGDPVPKASTENIRSKSTSSLALAAQIPDRAKSDPVIKQSLAWFDRLDTMKTETTQKIAAVKEQQKRGGGDAAILASQLGTLTNDSKRIEKDQAKAKETIKKQVKNLGFEWNESAAPETKQAGK